MGALSSLSPVRQGLKLKLEIAGREASIAAALCCAESVTRGTGLDLADEQR
jgi:hypothetical protein